MGKSINEIKNTLKILDESQKQNYIEELMTDEREGVKKIVESYEKQKQKQEKEINRIKGMITFDQDSITPGQIVAGVDEVGRGPLAGPVVAACVVIDSSMVIEGVNDSKKLTQEKREYLYDIIVQNSLYCSIGMIENDVIDKINILNATFLAMTSAINFVSKELKNDGKAIDLILVDGNQKIRDLDIKQQTVIGGDGISYAIACASIVAKVYRDRLMEKYDQKYPGYDFASNKGYGTSAHYDGLNNLGFTPIHRKSFCKSYFE
ncbi:MAG: ribonuclease HII [Proteocatella sp.]